MAELLTVGHGTLGQAELAALLSGAGLKRLVDVRRAPGSRRHPQFARDALEEWVPALGLAYEWEPRLGGWRKTTAGSPNTALRNDSFRGYADYMRTGVFWEALDAVLAGAALERSAVMCSESVYWRCHRRLISDAVVLARRGTVLHIGHDGRLTPHRLTDGVRADEGLLVYDAGASPMWEPLGR